MIEQQVADRFQEAVANEPPLGFDPDDVIDRAIKRSRRRKVMWAVVAATCVEAAVVWAVAGGSGAGTAQTPAAPPRPGPAPVVQPNPTFDLTGFEKTLTPDNPTDHRTAGSELMIEDMLARNPDGDSGTLRLKKGNDVVFEISLANFREYDMHYVEPVLAAAGVPVTLSVDCTASLHSCGGVSLTITGSTVVRIR